jgi:membrane associated rhomboid family serine protease
MLFPLGDDNPRRSTPIVTIALIAANAAVFLANNLGATEDSLREFFLRWGYDADRPLSVQAFTSMFMHGGFMHILGNMWVLWIVGDNVEDKLGRFRYLALYLIGGLVAVWAYSGIAQMAGPSPAAMEMFGRAQPPLVGASGAVYGVMGMYLVLFPEARIRLLFWFFLFVQVIRVPAKVFIGITIALDFLQTLIARGPAAGGVATAAHVGGGVFGIVAALALKKSVGGGAGGDAWDVHTGFSRHSHGGAESRGDLVRDDGDGSPWYTPPEPMEEQSAELENALVQLVRAGRTRDAIDVYPAYVSYRRERPLPPDVQLEIAHEFYRQGLARDGIAAYRRFLDTNPGDPDAPEAAFRIGILYARGLDDARSAVPWLRQAAESHGNAQVAAYAEQELRRLGG